MGGQGSARIFFSPAGRHGRFALGTTVLQAARELGVDLDSICGGRARCGRCQVEAVPGRFAREQIDSSPDHLSPIGPAERECRRQGRLHAGHRLGCQACITGDVRIEVPPGSRVHHPIVRKDCEARAVEQDPVVRLFFVEPGPVAKGEKPAAPLDRLRAALAEAWRVDVTACEPATMEALSKALQTGDGSLTAAVRRDGRVSAVWDGFRDRAYGAAVDIGSTTLAVHLCDLVTGAIVGSAGAMNPQIRYGEDLMSRVSYAQGNPGGAARMTDAVRAALDDLLRVAATDAGIDPDDILELTLVGNPVMHHLALGLDPTLLGRAPFRLVHGEAVERPATACGIGVNPGAWAYFLPCIAGHVGADAAAVLLAEAPWARDDVSLIVDVGTNAEIILGNRDRLLAASSPTGPAFEGGQISAGQRAAPGAIERVRIDPATLEPRFRVIGCSRWSDEAGFAEEVARVGVSGICGSGIIEAIAELYLAGVVRSDGRIDGSQQQRSARVQSDGRAFAYLLHDGERPIVIRQQDVRAIQLAKAALRAGTRLLMDRLGVQRVDRIRLAGAFGARIGVRHAMVLGMIPDCRLERVSAAGNAAGTGARIALLSQAARREIEARVRQVEKIEIATEPGFQQHFVAAMAIPHASENCPELARVVDLPDAPEDRGGRARRHRP